MNVIAKINTLSGEFDALLARMQKARLISRRYSHSRLPILLTLHRSELTVIG